MEQTEKRPGEEAALRSTFMSLEAIPLLDRALPFTSLLLALPIVAEAENHRLYAILFAGYMAANILVSHFGVGKSGPTAHRIEYGKSIGGVLFTSLVPILFEASPPIWLAAIPYILRITVVMPSRAQVRIMVAAHVLGPSMGVGYATGSLADALMPFSVLAGFSVISLTVIGFLQHEVRTSRIRHAFIQQASDLFYQISPEGKILDCNDMVLSRLSYTRDQLIGGHITTIYAEDSRAAAEANVETLLRNGFLHDVEMLVKARSGEVFPVLLSSILLRDEHDRIISAVAIQKDISKLKATERELRDAKSVAEEGTRAKSEFLATMSHEIRTPMNGVLGLAELLLDSDLNADQRQCISDIRFSASALLSILDDILDISRIEAGMLTIEECTFDLPATISQAIVVVSQRAQIKGLELHSKLDEALPRSFVGDVGRLRQVLVNLLNNAVKFTQEGSIELSVELLERCDAGLNLRFAVHDSGIGIPSAKQERLFELFTQADSSTCRKYGGAGLGLAICRRLVGLMGGEIGVFSNPEEGSTFWFILPLRSEDSRTEENSTPNGQTASDPACSRDPKKPPRVLLVEDDRINQKVARRMLEKMGCLVDVAGDGAEAVAAVRSEPYDVVFMDCQMPGVDGYTATTRIRELPEGSDLPIVALTANAMVGDREKCLACGMNDYITKPLHGEILAEALDRALQSGKRLAIDPDCN